MENKLYIQKLNSKITMEMVGNFFKVYIGNRFIRVKVTEDMIGHFFGEFVKTRKLHVFKKKT
jgi:ribosomal protein S19